MTEYKIQKTTRTPGLKFIMQALHMDMQKRIIFHIFFLIREQKNNIKEGRDE
jgi:hypothetical protein